MICKNCDKATTGGSRYCSASCKTVWNRNKRNNVTAAVTSTVTTSRDGPMRVKVDTSMPVQSFGESTTLPPITNYGNTGCACLHCAQNKGNGNRSVINHDRYKPIGELGPKEINRVSLPGDPDYAGVANG